MGMKKIIKSIMDFFDGGDSLAKSYQDILNRMDVENSTPANTAFKLTSRSGFSLNAEEMKVIHEMVGVQVKIPFIITKINCKNDNKTMTVIVHENNIDWDGDKGYHGDLKFITAIDILWEEFRRFEALIALEGK